MNTGHILRLNRVRKHFGLKPLSRIWSHEPYYLKNVIDQLYKCAGFKFYLNGHVSDPEKRLARLERYVSGMGNKKIIKAVHWDDRTDPEYSFWLGADG